MLETVTIDAKNKFSLGFFCECLLYYKKTVLICSGSTLSGIVTKCGIDNIHRLVRMDSLEIHLDQSTVGGGRMEGSKFMITAYTSEALNKERIIPRIADSTSKVYRDKIKIEDVLNKILLSETLGVEYVQELETELLGSDGIKHLVYMGANGDIARNAISIEVNKESEAIFDVTFNHDDGGNLLRDSLVKITFGQRQIHLAAKHNSQISVDMHNTPYVEYKSKKLITDFNEVSQEQVSFNKMVAKKMLDIKKTMNLGYRTFDDFMAFHYESTEFRNWLHGSDLNEGLLAAYDSAVEKKAFAQGLPSKTIKFIATVVVGAAVALKAPPLAIPAKFSAGLIYDRLFKTWKPNVFIKGPYNNFLAPPDTE